MLPPRLSPPGLQAYWYPAELQQPPRGQDTVPVPREHRGQGGPEQAESAAGVSGGGFSRILCAHTGWLRCFVLDVYRSLEMFYYVLSRPFRAVKVVKCCFSVFIFRSLNVLCAELTISVCELPDFVPLRQLEL